MKSRLVPGALVVAPGRVKDASLSLRAHPRPRLFDPVVFAKFQHDPVALVVLGVDISFIPAREGFEALHDRMIGLGDFSPDDASPVLQELSANQGDIFWRIQEAIRSAVQRNEAVVPARHNRGVPSPAPALSALCWHKS